MSMYLCNRCLNAVESREGYQYHTYATANEVCDSTDYPDAIVDENGALHCTMCGEEILDSEEVFIL